MAPHSRVVDSLLQRPLEMRKALCTASEAHLLAKVVPPLAADTALSTRHTYLEGDAITNGEAAYLRTNGDDNARGLMAQG